MMQCTHWDFYFIFLFFWVDAIAHLLVTSMHIEYIHVNESNFQSFNLFEMDETRQHPVCVMGTH